MENNKISVSMVPNLFYAKNLHCSQGDTKARKFEISLYDDDGAIDTSDVEIALPNFPVYKGGTEEILPANGSVPSTAPIIADIQYPQGLLNDQEFLYRESPSEEDGIAKFTSIKGNTLVWNQLVENGDFSASSGWAGQFATVTISNGVASVSQDRAGDYVALRKSNLQGLTGHKYLVVADVKSAKKTAIAFYLSNSFSSAYDIQANTRTVVHAIITVSNANTGGFNVYTNRKVELAEGDVVEFYHVMLFDLTQMGLDSITDPSDFTSLFSLPYYSYNQGTLLSFNGNGIKTTGKNLLSYSGENLPYNANGVSITREDNIYKVVASNPSGYPFVRISTIHYLPKGQYTVTMLGAETSNAGIAWRLIDRNVSPVKIFVNASASITTFTLNEDAHDVYFEITIDASKFDTGTWDVRFQLNMGTPSDYEPYTSTTTSLPISTYFPTGMKSAGSAYDELTPEKAITRIGAVDLGSLTWTKVGAISMFYATYNTDGKFHSGNELPNIKNTLYAVCSATTMYNNRNGIVTDDVITVNAPFLSSTEQRIVIADTSYTDANALKTALSGVYLYYELATETETDIESASLVTENGEIQLLPENDHLAGYCNEFVSKDAGVQPCKVKLANGEGVVYSNKIWLDVEGGTK